MICWKNSGRKVEKSETKFIDYFCERNKVII